MVYSPEPTVEGLIDTVLRSDGDFTDVFFSDVIASSTGKKILPIDRRAPTDREILDAIGKALDLTLSEFNQPGSPTSRENRINEASAHFEEAILRHLDAQPGILCELPRTADGNLQRAGYPDLKIIHESSGRVAYLDPKLVEQGSLDSSLRTFYYTPKTRTAKVLDDAHHLLAGIEHDGQIGKWKFLRWHLVDLAGFKVRLKAEFQASNKDLYLPELIIETRELPVDPSP